LAMALKQWIVLTTTCSVFQPCSLNFCGFDHGVQHITLRLLQLKVLIMYLESLMIIKDFKILNMMSGVFCQGNIECYMEEVIFELRWSTNSNSFTSGAQIPVELQ